MKAEIEKLIKELEKYLAEKYPASIDWHMLTADTMEALKEILKDSEED